MHVPQLFFKLCTSSNGKWQAVKTAIKYLSYFCPYFLNIQWWYVVWCSTVSMNSHWVSQSPPTAAVSTSREFVLRSQCAKFYHNPTIFGGNFFTYIFWPETNHQFINPVLIFWITSRRFFRWNLLRELFLKSILKVDHIYWKSKFISL